VKANFTLESELRLTNEKIQIISLKKTDLTQKKSLRTITYLLLRIQMAIFPRIIATTHVMIEF
jgi:hypothetical protein